MNVIESSSSDERLPTKTPSSTPAADLGAQSDVEQPLRTSSKRRRVLVASESSEEQEKISVGKKPLSPPADESLYMNEHSPSRKGRRLAHRREIEKHHLDSDEAENLADEVDEERM